MTKMRNEILDEEKIVRNNSNHIFERALEFQKMVSDRNVILTGSGTSYHAALFLSSLLLRNGKINVPIMSSEVPRSGLPKGIVRNSISFIFSHSGEGKDALDAARFLRKNGSYLVGLTDFSSSTLADISDSHVDLGAGKENSIAATKSHVVQLLFGKALAEADSGADYLRLVDTFVKEFDRIRRSEKDIVHLASVLKNKIVVLGTGIAVVLAMECSLKLKETSEVISEYYPVREYLHGPIQGANPDWSALFLSMNEPVFSKVINTGAAAHDIPSLFGIEENVDEVTGYFRLLPYLQLLSNYKATEMGKDPDNPSKLSKVVRS